MQDFAFLQEDIEAILLFTPQEKVKYYKRSDTYIILVAPHSSSKLLKEKVRETINLEERTYHVGVFGDFNLKLQHSIIEAHEIAWKQPDFRLSRFFATYRRRWKDHRKSGQKLKWYLLSRGGFIGFIYLIAYFFPRFASVCAAVSVIVGLLVVRKVLKLTPLKIGLLYNPEGKSREQLMTEYFVMRQEEAKRFTG